MISNYKGFDGYKVDKSLFEVPIGWWDIDKTDLSSVYLSEVYNIVVSGVSDEDLKDFVRAFVFNTLNNYKQNEVCISILDYNTNIYDDYKDVPNVSLSKGDIELEIGIKEIFMDIDKRLSLLDSIYSIGGDKKPFKCISDYNKYSSMGMPYKLVVLPSLDRLYKSKFICNFLTNLKEGEGRKRGTIDDKLYVKDCIDNAYRCGVYFITSLSSDLEKSVNKSPIMMYTFGSMLKGLQIGFQWNKLAPIDKYNVSGKGVIKSIDEDIFNLYSSRITKVDLQNKLRELV